MNCSFDSVRSLFSDEVLMCSCSIVFGVRVIVWMFSLSFCGQKLQGLTKAATMIAK